MSRVGVFICHCGVNISSTVDVEKLCEEFAQEDGVAIATEYKYMCSDPGQRIIKEAIEAHNLDSIVVASCSPRLHERTFQLCIEGAGLNRYKLEMANIREQCSWVHKDKEYATLKAKDLIKMAVAKARKNQPFDQLSIPVLKKALVIGGGIAGMQAAIDIAKAGHKVTLVERTPTIGGRMAQLDKTFPTLDCSA